MWRPRTEAELQAAIENDVLRESASFDAKRQLPARGRNRDLAKDICAMTVEGGLLLYGIGGEDPTRPDTRQHFDLAGAAERIDQVAQTGIAEPPVIEIHDIPSAEQPGCGYLCVVVPASPRAPHMLTIDGDNRYWGRGATGNRILTEGEVARLYERRERWESDREHLLDETITSMPFTFDPEEHGVIVVAVRPVIPPRPLLRAAAGEQRLEDFIQRELLPHAHQTDPYPDQGTHGLGDAFGISRLGADRWLCTRDPNPATEYQARVELDANGSLTYWHSPLINDIGRGRIVMERSVTRAVYQAVGTAAWLYERAGFHGPVDILMAALGIETAGGATLMNVIGGRPTYGAADYRRHARVTSEELRDPETLVRAMLAPLFEVIARRDYDPLGEGTDGL